jgi:hypothetical protein
MVQNVVVSLFHLENRVIGIMTALEKCMIEKLSMYGNWKVYCTVAVSFIPQEDLVCLF